MRRIFIFVMLAALGCLGPAWAKEMAEPSSASPAVLQGVFFLGDSILAGKDLKPGQKNYADLFTEWLKSSYGPITEIRDSESNNTAELYERIENRLAGVTMSLCVLEIGTKNLDFRVGGPNVSTCGGCSVRAGLLASFHYGAELQKILSVVRSHMAPGGLILMTNLYEVDECTRDHFENWNEYPQVLQIYNRVTAMAAEVNDAKLVDLFALMAKNPSCFDSCGQYPNAAGHVAIAELLEKTVKETTTFPPKTSINP